MSSCARPTCSYKIHKRPLYILFVKNNFSTNFVVVSSLEAIYMRKNLQQITFIVKKKCNAMLSPLFTMKQTNEIYET